MTITAVVLLLVLAGSRAQTTFIQITNDAIVNDIGLFGIGAWCDFNNDGFLDLFLSNWNGTNVYYRNHGDGTFTRLTLDATLEDADYHGGPAAADYDNDGYPDLVVPAGVEAPTPGRNILYHNNGDGTFSRVSGGSLTNQLGFFANASWADYNNDGFADLFVTDWGASRGGGKNLLFHNNGDGTFNKVTAGSIVNDLGIGFAALWTDYDSDGFMDLVVLNMPLPGAPVSHSFVYHNNRDGTFTRVLTNTVATDGWPNGAGAGAWGDYDNDGLPDLFVCDDGGQRNRLYHNTGSGSFSNITSGVVLVPPSTNGAVDCAWGDYDNDGYLDLFVGSRAGPNALYHNNGDGTFTSVLSEPPVSAGRPGILFNRVAWVDYDNDGSLDLFLTRFTMSPNDGPASSLLFHNKGNTNAWLEVKLVGGVSNRSGIGAKIRLHATIGGKSFWQLRELTSGGGWDMHPLVAHFGLGNATNVETLRIEWPSTIVQEFHDLPSKKILTIYEPPRLLASVTNSAPQFSIHGVRGLQYRIEASTNLAAWSGIGILTITNSGGTAQITDTNAASGFRFYRAVSQ
jgi:hypothetical protein